MAKHPNAADADEVRSVEEFAEFDDAQIAEDTRNVMRTAGGRRFVWWLLDMAGIHRTSMIANSFIYFNEGRRDIGLQVEAHLIDVCDRDFIKMRDESIARAKKRKLALEELEKKQQSS